MKDKTKEQLINELVKLCQQVAEFGKSEAAYKQIEEEKCKVHRALNVLRNCNRALVCASEESELLGELCRIIVDVGKYHLAWIGFAEQDEKKTVRPVVQVGYEEGYLDTVNITWADTEWGCGPTGTAIRTGKPSICRNMLTDPKFAPWRDEATRRGYASSIAFPLTAKGRTFGALNIYAVEPNAFDEEEVNLLVELADDLAYGITALRTRAGHKRAEEELQHSMKQLRKALEGIVQVVASTVEVRDPYTAGHQRRVANLSKAIAKKMGLSEDQIDGLYMVGVIHDLGKISVPAEILAKPSQLTDIEFSLIKTHPQIGYDILKTIEFPWPIARIVLQHHERMDGNGYPSGLSGEDILKESRILAVADVIEAMASHRPYRPALGIDKALEEISQNKGNLYDPEVADACIQLFTEKGFEFE